MTALYAISVRRAGTLPSASFRFRVTPDTLAARLTVPTIRVRRGLSPPSQRSTTIVDHTALARHAPCQAHTGQPLTCRAFGQVQWFGWNIASATCQKMDKHMYSYQLRLRPCRTVALERGVRCILYF